MLTLRFMPIRQGLSAAAVLAVVASSAAARAQDFRLVPADLVYDGIGSTGGPAFISPLAMDAGGRVGFLAEEADGTSLVVGDQVLWTEDPYGEPATEAYERVGGAPAINAHGDWAVSARCEDKSCLIDRFGVHISEGMPVPSRPDAHLDGVSSPRLTEGGQLWFWGHYDGPSPGSVDRGAGIFVLKDPSSSFTTVLASGDTFGANVVSGELFGAEWTMSRDGEHYLATVAFDPTGDRHHLVKDGTVVLESTRFAAPNITRTGDYAILASSTAGEYELVHNGETVLRRGDVLGDGTALDSGPRDVVLNERGQALMV